MTISTPPSAIAVGRSTNTRVNCRLRLNLPEESAYEWSYVAREGDQLFASSAKPGSTYTDYWGKASWYDATQGPGTYKVCSERFFALDAKSGDVAWSYEGGKIVNTTIAIGDGTVYFVESRHPALAAAETSRIEMDELWLEQYMVALDVKTGEKRWEQPLDLEDGVVVFFMVYTDNTLTITSSHTGKYFLYAFDTEAGKPLWDATHAWPNGDHGGHMQHQAIARNTVFVEPHGYDLRTGRTGLRADRQARGLRHGRRDEALADLSWGVAPRVAMWGMDEQKASTWTNLRPSCWLSIVPANGMIMAPEGGGGCSCGGWMETSLGFIPKALLSVVEVTKHAMRYSRSS